jgi:hypothetical protein
LIAVCYSSHRKLIPAAGENVSDKEKTQFPVSQSLALITPNPKEETSTLSYRISELQNH